MLIRLPLLPSITGMQYFRFRYIKKWLAGSSARPLREIQERIDDAQNAHEKLLKQAEDANRRKLPIAGTETTSQEHEQTTHLPEEMDLEGIDYRARFLVPLSDTQEHNFELNHKARMKTLSSVHAAQVGTGARKSIFS